jgi:hypothetical protein
MRCIRMVIGLFGMLSAATPLFASEEVRKPPENPAIGTLRAGDLQSLPYICECEFFQGPINGVNTVFATRKQRVVAFVMVDGSMVALRREGKPNDASCRKNARHRERWIDGPTAVALDYRVTGRGAEACWFEGRMNVAVGGRTTSTAISGACGC